MRCRRASNSRRLIPENSDVVLAQVWWSLTRSSEKLPGSHYSSHTRLRAILRTSEWLFVGFKLVGAAYLLYLGIGLLLTCDKRSVRTEGSWRPAHARAD